MTFREKLEQHRLQLERVATTTLQVNIGRRCDLACRHCHLDAGPQHTATISTATRAAVIALARRYPFATIDITGGAPELVPGLSRFLAELAPLCEQLLLRTNLTALANPADPDLLETCRACQVTLIASLPAPDAGRTSAQRGPDVWERSLEMLRQLNRSGYGQPESGLKLDLVTNPGGAFLPPSQAEVERRFRRELGGKHGIAYHQLYSFANAPLGRFRQWLEAAGNLDAYQALLTERFNPEAVSRLMCRSLLSIDQDGFLYDCDFNLSSGLDLGGKRTHIDEIDAPPQPGAPIAVGEHCYACTAGAGFTCQGAIAT